MKKKYYDGKKLTIGVLTFGIAMLLLGMLVVISVKDGVQDINDVRYTISFIACIIMMFVGEGFILDAASYDANCTKDDSEDKDGT